MNKCTMTEHAKGCQGFYDSECGLYGTEALTNEKPLIKITKKQWNNIPNEYKGQWTERVVELRGDIPTSYVGKKNVLSGCISEDMGALLTEGIHFEIVDSRGGEQE